MDVYRHLRTSDLGKWNISIHKDSYQNVTTWLDNHLATKFALAPPSVQNAVTFEDFSQPMRLAAGRSVHSVSSRSVFSGLTEGGTSAYTEYLKAKFITMYVVLVSVLRIPSGKSSWRRVVSEDQGTTRHRGGSE